MTKMNQTDNRKLRWTAIKQRFRQNHITLRDYQVEGIKWMLSKEEKYGKKGGLLGDEPGLGKTFQSISLVFSGKGISLVVVPASILGQWKRDAILLCGLDKVYIHHTGHRQRTIPKGTQIVITTPQTLMVSDKESRLANLIETPWERVIIDEIQCMKNASSKIYKTARLLNSKYRWGLTGTPIQNSRKEVINLFKFIYNVPKGYDIPYSLEECLERDCKRRRKIDKLDIKPVEIENVEVDFSCPEERDFYKKVQNNIRKEFAALVEGANENQAMVILFELLLRLRQTSIHPQLVIDGYERKWGKKIQGDWTNNSSKHQTLFNMIQEHPKDATIIFSQFTSEIVILDAELKSRGLRVMRLDGSNGAGTREEVLETCQSDWNTHPENKIDVLLVQIKAGGVGLNLQNFNRVYITSPDWNPANEDQAIARAWRLGQEKQVVVKRLLLKDSMEEVSVIDERLMATQEGKRQLYSELLKEDDQLSTGKRRKMGRMKLTKRDLRRLLR